MRKLLSPEERRALEAEWEKKVPVEEDAPSDILSFVPIDPIDRAIELRLQEEGANNRYAGSPESLKELVRQILEILDSIVRVSKDAKVGVHRSCITEEDCLVVAEPKGERYHISTKNIPNYSREHVSNILLDFGYVLRFWDEQ